MFVYSKALNNVFRTASTENGYIQQNLILSGNIYQESTVTSPKIPFCTVLLGMELRLYLQKSYSEPYFLP